MKISSGGMLAAVVFLALPLRAADDGAAYRTNGYSLLYKLCDQEKPVDMILIVKTTPKEIADYLHQVSASARQDVAWLDDLQEHDKGLTFDQSGLPPFEEATRASIQDSKEHLLLFGSSGSAFVRALLVTQIEAGTYATNLAKVLANSEPDEKRAAVVRKIGARWEKLRDRAYALLNAT
jgi:hypothetical protein